MEIYINGEDYEFFGKLRGSNRNKFNRVAKLASMYDQIDAKMDRFISRTERITEHTQCALAIRLLLRTGIRIGNEPSSEGYMTKPHPHNKKEPEFVQTFGLTTLRRKHLTIKNGQAHLYFTGKKQVQNSFTIDDPMVVEQLGALLVDSVYRDSLFEFNSYRLTRFIKTYVGKQFCPKDFRTLRANMLAYDAWCELPGQLPQNKTAFNKEVKQVCEYVSEHLNNTPGVCKRSYIDDLLFTHMAEERFNK